MGRTKRRQSVLATHTLLPIDWLGLLPLRTWQQGGRVGGVETRQAARGLGIGIQAFMSFRDMWLASDLSTGYRTPLTQEVQW